MLKVESNHLRNPPIGTNMMLKLWRLPLGLLCLSVFISGALHASPVINTNNGSTGAQESAEDKLLALNVGMFSLYDNAQITFKQEFLAEHPLIISLFSGSGGKMILYRPGKAPEEAPPVPQVYQYLKSTGP